MNYKEKKYSQYSLALEMLETVDVINNFDWNQAPEIVEAIKERQRVFFTGEGSSRIFPAKQFIYQAQRMGSSLAAFTDGSRQAEEYDLSDSVVLATSNSGRTKETVTLVRRLKLKKHPATFSLSVFPKSSLGNSATQAYVLGCGEEQAVAATKSVVEQALFYHSILDRVAGKGTLKRKAKGLAKRFSTTLMSKIDPRITDALANAEVIHWAGRNTGVAEELTLKTNEITRKRSAYLEGTYAVHGIEEVLTKKDAVIVIDPFKEEEDKFEEVLVNGVGCTVIVIAPRKTRFPTVRIPPLVGLEPYLRMGAGWNMLVEIGLACNINLDETVRARKIGNEMKPTAPRKLRKNKRKI